LGALVALALLPPLCAQAQKQFEYDILELPAVPSEKATKSMIYTIKKFGDRYFATGHHGHLL
jgi:hypothetical protein